MTEPKATQWTKSSYSGGGDGNNCVEIALLDGLIGVRESDDPGAVVMTGPGSLRGFFKAVKDGEFDHLA